MIGPPDDPEDALSEASAERGRGGDEQEGDAVPPHPERAGRGEGDERPAAEAAARPAPAVKVRSLIGQHSLSTDVKVALKIHFVADFQRFSFTDLSFSTMV